MAGGGSVLKRLKNNLQENNLLRHQGAPNKKKKRSVAEKKDQKERDQRVLQNIRNAFSPFEVKTNKEKFEILGKSKQPGEKGRPTVAKSTAESQRKQTYEVQKRIKNRIGGLVDRRFGEKDKSMTTEEKMVARYAREKLMNTKKSKFDLNDDEGEDDVLTHGGRALTLADDFAEDDLGVGSDDEPSAKRIRRESFHEEEVEDDENEPVKKSKHDVMKEVIAKSKMHKALRQQTNAENDEMVNDLNEESAFNELLADLHAFDKEHVPTWSRSKEDEYDLHVREMAFERRAQPTDRTKTEEELREEAEAKRKALEAERQARMEGDDLEDGLDLGEDGARDDAALFGLNDEEEAGSPVARDDDDSDEESATNEPSVNVPRSLSELKDALGSEDQLQKLRSIIKRCDPSLRAGNKEAQAKLTTLIARYAAVTSQTAVFNGLVNILRELAPTHNMILGQYFRDAVERIHNQGVSKQSSLRTLVLIGSLFSTSDQWHVVANAATLVVTKHLSQDVNAKDAALNLFLSDLLLFYQRLSKRYIPEVVVTVTRALAAAVDDSSEAERYTRLAKGDLKPTKAFKSLKEPPVLSISQLSQASNDEVVLSAVRCVERASSLWRSIDAYPEVFGLLVSLLKQLPSNKYVEGVCERLERSLNFSTKERKPLQLQDLRPIALVTHAPMFEENYNPEVKGYDMDPEKRELAKLKSQLKKERKSTLKEIRRDAEFESREKLKETRQSAAEYHRKLARITNQINSEEGAERNLYEREKRSAKRRRN